MRSLFVLLAGVLLFCVQASASETPTPVSGPAPMVEAFATAEGMLHGIAFDGKGYMYVGRNGKEVLKVTPEGHVSQFAVIKAAEGYFIEGHGNTFLYDMEFGQDGFLYMAVEDRILKASPDGRIVTLLQGEFAGIWGACGIAVDQKGNVYFSYDDKIERLSPQGKRDLFLDGSRTRPILHAIVGIEFDREHRNLFACDGELGQGKLVKIPVAAHGAPDSVELVHNAGQVNTEYLAMDEMGAIYAKGPSSSEFIRLGAHGRLHYFRCKSTVGYGLQTIALGRHGFDSRAIYGTHLSNGTIYKITFP